MQQRHTLRAARVHADSRTNRRRTRGADTRAAMDEYPDEMFATRGLEPWEIEESVNPRNDHQAARAAQDDDVPMCACGRDFVGNLGTHCLQCELEPFGIAWQHEQDGRL